ncbi:MAG: beta-N-acetylhexosaminidase [Gammaproteobacteria bacterium]|nr:MAG: beta-N-acetylhexosaminidase [Gammaproteobacteria bacterium]
MDRPVSGPLVVDIEGQALTDEDCTLLLNPWVGGVILFQRNIRDAEQCRVLIREVRSVRPDLLITVDQEGGRVRRLTKGVLNVPDMRTLATGYDEAPESVLGRIRAVHAVMGQELAQLGFDLTWAPVADLDRGLNSVIAERSFGAQPEKVAACVQAAAQGLSLAGMCPVLKHFPGHGGVAEDTHDSVAVDQRDPADWEQDLEPFRAVLSGGARAGVMLSHVRAEAFDAQPAVFSRTWINEVLREQWGFDGPIVTDDLSMKGAGGGSAGERVLRALEAGADAVLLCNDRRGVFKALRALDENGDRLWDEVRARRMATLRVGIAQAGDWDVLKQNVERVLNGLVQAGA